MGANPTQAVGITAFLLGFTALSGALYKGGSAMLVVLAVALLAGAVGVFLKCKPLENVENGG